MFSRIASITAALLALSCNQQPALHAPSTMAGTGGSARVHMRDGSVYNLSSWRRDGERLRGRGAHYDVERRPVREGAFEFNPSRHDYSDVKITTLPPAKRVYGGEAEAADKKESTHG